MNFLIYRIHIFLGSRRMLDVMDVNTQKNFEMTMKEWTKYYEEGVKDKLLNVISLEFSHTKLENYIKRPNIVCILYYYNHLIITHYSIVFKNKNYYNLMNSTMMYCKF